MDVNYVLKALGDKLRADLDKTFEEEKQRVIKRLEAEKEKVIATTMLSLSRHLSITTASDVITLRVEKQ